MKTIENLTSVNHQNEIEETLRAYFFPWHYNAGTATGPKHLYKNYKNVSVFDSPQFTHIFRDDAGISQFYSLVHPLILMAEKELDMSLSKNIHRVKANFLLPDVISAENTYHYPHQDISIDNTGLKIRTLLYYVNDCDGDTVIFNEKNVDSQNLTEMERSSPKKGKAIFFDSSHLHCSTPPKNNRYVINIVFKF